MQEHELVMYKRVQGRLSNLRKGMQIRTHGPLIKALDRLSCVPFASFPVQILWDPEIVIAGKEAGTLGKPDVDVILKHSKPSPFGKGEETVMDETYRRGREISAADITFPGHEYHRILLKIQSVVSAALFIPRDVTVNLYKLAIYREGGHFDWHKDTTHSDNHHATVLVALNTSWTGGDFILRRNGIETRMDMQPKVIPPRHKWEDEPTIELRAVAFYTDTEHRVEPVTEGVRIVLQYDVEVVGWLSDKKGKKDQGEGKKRKAEEDEDEGEDEEESADNKKRKTEHEEKDQAEETKRKAKQDEDGGEDDNDDGEADDEGDEDEDDEDDDMKDEPEDDDDDSDDQSNSDDMDVDPRKSKLDVIHEFSSKREVLNNPSQIGDPAVVDDVVNIVGGLLTNRREEVAFALQYLYRKSSILPKFLKASDLLLYQALSKTFDVSLHPVVLEETSDYEGGYGIDAIFCAYKFDQGADANASDDEDDEDEDDDEDDDDEDEDEDDEEDDGEDDDKKKKKKKRTIFFVSRSSAIEQLSHQGYVEYTGNEAILREDKYFGGGMFVRRKGALEGA